jgi:hypothetical protein
MDITQSNLRPDRWPATAFGFMAVLFLLFLIVAPALRRVGTTLFIDKSGIVRLGGVPLQKKSTRISVLRVVGWVNGGKFVIEADTSAKFSSVVEALDSMQKAGVTLAPPQRRRDEKVQ